MITLTAVIYPDEEGDWLIAHNPETGTTTQGKTVEEAVANLKEPRRSFTWRSFLCRSGRERC